MPWHRLAWGRCQRALNSSSFIFRLFDLLHSGDSESDVTPFLLTFSRIMECHGKLGPMHSNFSKGFSVSRLRKGDYFGIAGLMSQQFAGRNVCCTRRQNRLQLKLLRCVAWRCVALCRVVWRDVARGGRRGAASAAACLKRREAGAQCAQKALARAWSKRLSFNEQSRAKRRAARCTTEGQRILSRERSCESEKRCGEQGDQNGCG